MSYFSIGLGASTIHVCRSCYHTHNGRNYLSCDSNNSSVRNNLFYRRGVLTVGYKNLSEPAYRRAGMEKYFPCKGIDKMELVWIPEGEETENHNDSIITHMCWVFHNLKMTYQVKDSEKVIIAIPPYYKDNQRVMIKKAAEIVFGRDVELVQEGLAMALRNRHYEQMVNDRPVCMCQYLDIGATHCTIYNVYFDHKDITLVSSFSTKEVTGDSMTKALWELIKEKLQEASMDENGELATSLNEEGLSIDDLLTSKAFMNNLHDIEAIKSTFSEKNAEEAAFQFNFNDQIFYNMDLSREEYNRKIAFMQEEVKQILGKAFDSACGYLRNIGQQPPLIRRLEVVGGASKTIMIENTINDFINEKQVYYELDHHSLTLSASCCAYGGVLSQMKEPIPGRVDEDAVMNLHVIQYGDTMVSFIGAGKKRTSEVLMTPEGAQMGIPTPRAVGKRVKLNEIEASVNHNILVKSIDADNQSSMICEFSTDGVSTSTHSDPMATFSLYLDESDVLNCECRYCGKEVRIAKRIYVKSKLYREDAFFSCSHDVVESINHLKEMCDQEEAVDGNSCKLWQVKAKLEGERMTEPSVIERTVYNYMEKQRADEETSTIGTLRDRVDKVCNRFTETYGEEIPSEFNQYRLQLDRKRIDFIPNMEAWIETVTSENLKRMLMEELSIMKEIIYRRQFTRECRMEPLMDEPGNASL